MYYRLPNAFTNASVFQRKNHLCYFDIFSPKLVGYFKEMIDRIIEHDSEISHRIRKKLLPLFVNATRICHILTIVDHLF